MKPRSLAEAEMLATLVPGNVQPPPERRTGGIGLTEITFVAGALLFLAGIALVSIPAALIVGGVGLGALAWRLS